MGEGERAACSAAAEMLRDSGDDGALASDLEAAETLADLSAAKIWTALPAGKEPASWGERAIRRAVEDLSEMPGLGQAAAGRPRKERSGAAERRRSEKRRVPKLTVPPKSGTT